MSDDEPDPELLQLLRERLGLSQPDPDEISPDTGVLRDAEHIYSNAIDVSIDMYGTRAAAIEIHKAMQERNYSTETWSQHELHPKPSEGFSELDIVNFVFTMDLLNFSFWSELPQHERYQVEYRDHLWTGYNSLVACLRRALDEGIPITTPRFWNSPRCTNQMFDKVFRSATTERIPLFQDRVDVLREAGAVLQEVFGNPDHEAFEDDAEPELDNITTISVVPEQDWQTFPAAPTIGDPIQDDSAKLLSGDELAPDASQSHLDQASNTDDLPGIPSPSRDTSATNLPPSSDPDANLTSTASESLHNGDGAGRVSASVPVHDEQPPNTAASQTALAIWSSDLRRDHAVLRIIEKADHSAGKLVNLLVKHFSCFQDETRFDGRRVRLLKRAQIFVADLWAALNKSGPGQFYDIDHLTMFADYRVPQSLHSLGVLVYSPPLDYHIRNLRFVESGHSWEVQLRGCSIWAVELIRREILKNYPEATTINAVLIDFFLYDIAKEREAQGANTPPTSFLQAPATRVRFVIR